MSFATNISKISLILKKSFLKKVFECISTVLIKGDKRPFSKHSTFITIESQEVSFVPPVIFFQGNLI